MKMCQVCVCIQQCNVFAVAQPLRFRSRACLLTAALHLAHAVPTMSADADWDACLAALEKVKEHNHALALQQLQHGAGKALHRNSFASATSDVFHDACSHTMSDTSVSEAEHREVEQYLAEMEMLCRPAPCRELSCTPTCVPDPPLMFAPKHWKYCQVDPSAFCAYWERDQVRSTPFPLPADMQMKLSKLARSCHESIPGMWVSNSVAPTETRFGCGAGSYCACLVVARAKSCTPAMPSCLLRHVC